MARGLRVCRLAGCPELTRHTSGLCPDHLAAERRALDERRGSARQRGYDRRHDVDGADAKRVAVAERQNCPRCGEPLLPGQPLDFGHTVDRATDPNSRADRVEHASCNRAAGGRRRQPRR